MSYSTGEAAILALVRELSGYDTNNTSQGQWGILNKGKYSTFVIIKRGETQRQPQTPTTVLEQFSSLVQVWKRYDENAYAGLISAVGAIATKIDANRYLGLGSTSAIMDSNVTAIGEVVELWKPPGTVPIWIRQEIRVDWIEQTVITYEE